jgi:hypothetical protein
MEVLEVIIEADMEAIRADVLAALDLSIAKHSRIVRPGDDTGTAGVLGEG